MILCCKKLNTECLMNELLNSVNPSVLELYLNKYLDKVYLFRWHKAIYKPKKVCDVTFKILHRLPFQIRIDNCCWDHNTCQFLQKQMQCKSRVYHQNDLTVGISENVFIIVTQINLFFMLHRNIVIDRRQTCASALNRLSFNMSEHTLPSLERSRNSRWSIWW